MPPEVEVRFERIESLLYAVAERENQMEERARQRAEKHERNMQRIEQRRIREHERSMARMGAFERQLAATRDLVRAGVKMVTKLSVEVDKVSRIQKAMLRLHGSGHSSRN